MIYLILWNIMCIDFWYLNFNSMFQEKKIKANKSVTVNSHVKIIDYLKAIGGV